jgi:hypothetical protein
MEKGDIGDTRTFRDTGDIGDRNVGDRKIWEIGNRGLDRRDR